MQKLVTWAVQVGIAIALAMGATLARGRGTSLLLAGMAGGAAIASVLSLWMRPPEALARPQRDGATSISTFEG
ncbi:MAG TPA: hypothetical protein VLD58_11170 [Gemmatimonadales bacterium]|nr:hypothetical protein [Gemmatimonadales bacterium]